MKTTVVYHSADFDGLFCREIARKFMPDAELIGWNFGNKPLEIPPDGPIYVLDLPVDRVFGFAFAHPDETKAMPEGWAWLKRVIWIDHHASSIEAHPTSIPGYRIDGVAACRLAWQWFTNTLPAEKLPTITGYIERTVSEPLAVRLAGEYDIWDKRDPRAEIFQLGLRSRELTGSDWAWFLTLHQSAWGDAQIDSSINELLVSGAILQRYQKDKDVSAMKSSFLVDFEGLKLLALNSTQGNSLVFASKDVPETGHDALCLFSFNGRSWRVSLYHANHRKDLDLYKIAAKYGGGGHRGACGFECKGMLPFVLGYEGR